MLNIQTPAARETDPETSHIAADKITKSGERKLQQERVADAVRRWPGCTSAELAEKMRADRTMPARRLKEIETAGAVVRGHARYCDVRNTKAVTWWPINSEQNEEKEE